MKPKLKEVKKHFENALTVKCLADGKENHINNFPYLLKGTDSFESGSILYAKKDSLDLQFSEYFIAWNKKDGYAEILTYKEKTFSITESQIKKLKEREGSKYIEEWFSEAFESEVKKLKVGVWYNVSDIKDGSLGFCGLGMYTEEKHEAGLLESDNGFNFKQANGKIWRTNGKIKEATEQEVFEALKNEAFKRGFVEGAYFIEPTNQPINDSKKRLAKGSIEFYGDEMNKLCFKNSDSLIYREGIWGEAVETITLSEAEQQLGKKIILNK